MKKLALILIPLCALVAASQATSTSPQLSAAPVNALFDSPATISVSRLKPGVQVTITAKTSDERHRAWISRATFVANSRGVVDLRRSRALRGSYSGARPMGLFWSMLPVGWRKSPKAASMFPAPEAPVRISARVKGRLVARTQIVRRTSSPDVSIQATSLAREGFIGHYCSTLSPTPRPAIVRLGGSEGGLPGDLTCALFASHGYPTLSLAYFGLPGLPPALSKIPLEYFKQALQWLAAQPGVDATRLTVLGSSRGGEAALILGAIYPEYVDSVIGLVPSSRVTGGVPHPDWMLEGKALPFVTIPVERIRGPVFALGAGNDAVWPSGLYVRAIGNRLRAHHHPGTALVFRSAGHMLGTPLPNLHIGTESADHRIRFGGSPSADARARSVAWPRLLQFLGAL